MTAAMVKIKPLSSNQAWQGRRFSTKAKKKFEQDVCLMLPGKIETSSDKLQIYLEFGFSSKASDWDNPIKTFVDCLEKKYGINDNRIYRAVVQKEIVPKGKEYIYFDLREYEEPQC